MSLRCYHCDQKVMTGRKYQIELAGELKFFCCLGCQSVASIIMTNGLNAYYQYRTKPATKNELTAKEIKALSIYDHEDIQREFVLKDKNNKSVTLSLSGVSCAACAWLIEKKMQNEQGVIQIRVNTTTNRAQISWNEQQTSLSKILGTIHQLGYKAIPFEISQQEALFQQNIRHFLYKIGVAGLASMQVMMFAVALYMDFFQGIEDEFQQLFRWVSFIFATPVLLYSASPFYINAWRNLKAGTLGMDVPVSAALLLAYIASCYATITKQGEVYFESVTMFVFLLLLGRFFELKTKYRAAAVNVNLLTLVPKMATLVSGKKIPAKSLTSGMKVIVLPGETIPADGKILSGETSVNEAMLTGESLPLSKKKLDSVYAGTLNIDGNIEFEVSCEYKESLLANIVRLQDNALLTKPKLVLIADKVAAYFVGAILCIAICTWGYWQTYNEANAFWIMLSVLVATCPCALSLATPTAITCAISAFGRLGIIVKKSHIFETLTKVNHVVLDKTGTLTQGNISITSVLYFGKDFEHHGLKIFSKQHAMEIAQSLEAYSSHPIANAFRKQQPFSSKYKLQEVKNEIGKGVSALVCGKEWRIGNKQFALFAEKEKPIEHCQVWLSCEGKKIAGFYLQDSIRDSSYDLVDKLKKQNITITMLTGDNEKNAKKIAQKLNITKLVANVSPQEKMEYIQNLKKEDVSMMIGDGVNDAPVLACAHLSVAMEGGTDIAKSSADMVLLSDDLTTLLAAQKLAQFTKKIIGQNLAWALGYNVLVLPLAVSGMLSPYLAVIGMSTSSIIVLSNSFRINGFNANS